MKTNEAITSADVDRSYLVLALLQVTRDAADFLNDHGDEPDGQKGQRSGAIVAVLSHISELQGELHGAIERATRTPAGETE
ncbi:hypothetical protein PMI07_002393 [Rhizobium sp. CF080]|uniref:hypothetical protein n=1 Tax=Rhizobium sp. (strain CF080) TaxID=1144310 RepID=UPI000271C61C|nr:hypothetical protein [Rhizobium sp. CF080]EUB95905.1 hypothetical protein PMI07_002393 [Rhizobium sp. CF080]